MYCGLSSPDGQPAVGLSGLKLTGMPHWKPAMKSVLPEAPLRPEEECFTLVPQAASRLLPATPAPTTAEPAKNWRRETRSDMCDCHPQDHGKNVIGSPLWVNGSRLTSCYERH